jgi:hypothetical protein
MTLLNAARTLFRRPGPRATPRPARPTRLFVEPLEDRSVPEVFTVNSLADSAPGRSPGAAGPPGAGRAFCFSVRPNPKRYGPVQ